MKGPSVLLLLCMLTFTTFAQQDNTKQKRFYICEGVGYAIGTTSAVYVPYYEEKTILSAATISFAAGYAFSRKFSLGIVGGYYHAKAYGAITEVTGLVADPAANDYKLSYRSCHMSRETYYFGVEARYLYATIRKNRTELYGAAGIGITSSNTVYGGEYYDYFPNKYQPVIPNGFYDHDFNKDLVPDINITTIGIRSTQRLFWYAEAGFGYKGLVNGGVGYKF